VPTPPDDRSPIAVGMEWTTRIITIALEMALPGLAGYWVDQKLGTVVLFLILGVVLGFLAGIWHLIRLTVKPGQGGTRPRSP